MSLAANTAREAVRTLRATINDEPTPDLIADLREAERILAEFRREVLSEVAGPLNGREWRLVESNSAKRSYNDDGLLAAFGGTGALPHLIRSGAVKLAWSWTNLRRAARAEDITLTVASHEVAPGDPEGLVGEVWTSRLDLEANT